MLRRGYILDGRYEVIRALRELSNGTIYLCKNVKLKNLVTLREIHKDIKGNLDILNEYNHIKILNHNGILKTLEIFYENTYFYMVQEYQEGETLKEFVGQVGSLETMDIYNITLSLLNIIEYLKKSKSIINIKINPNNIIINKNKEIYIMDFEGLILDEFCEDKDLPQESHKEYINTIGRLMYFMARGKVPCTDLEPLIDDDFINNVEYNLKNIIQRCFHINEKYKYSSMDELNKEIRIELLKKIKFDGENLELKYNDSLQFTTRAAKTRKLNAFKRILGFV